jgi:MazG family protein
MSSNRPIDDLLTIMRQLRDPQSGCPWDIEQDFSTIAPYTIEEAYEVADAIEREDYADLKDELGDLLLQVVFHAQMAKEAGLFDFDDVCQAINDKMIRRHPHVFGNESHRDSEEQTEAWEEQKARERAAKNRADSVLDDVPVALPALKRAQKLQKRAARVGFDWPDAERVLDKVHE